MDEADAAPVVNEVTSTSSLNYDSWLWDDIPPKKKTKSAEYTLFPVTKDVCSHEWSPYLPEYMSYTERLKTFEKWPRQIIPTGVELARTGFVYFGTGDEVHCFSCGLCLHNWETKDSASVEHRKWSRFCKYMMMTHLSQ